MKTETSKQKSLAGRTALVTGASRGIGRAIAVKLAKEGAFTYVNFIRNEKAARETLKIIEDGRGKGTLFQFDVKNADAAKDAITDIAAEKGSLDILVNNAGITLDGIFARTKEESWNDVIDTNLKGVFNCSKSAIRYMMKQRWGRIINMTSIVAEAGNAGQVCYSASKAGIIGLTKSLAREIGSRNICINAVAPGF
ncbi:MAG: SDR family NAD(P)-dependent oxidoreductase, partial [Thermodesulfobacteriota bacterium]|nr:SDR family NAD(P)-dependent oxidoreductase [Thermodesulfobacteriota bacterium]